jgi:hypothetical protein
MSKGVNKGQLSFSSIIELIKEKSDMDKIKIYKDYIKYLLQPDIIFSKNDQEILSTII